MRTSKTILLLSIAVLPLLCANAQNAGSSDFYGKLRKFNLARVIRPDSIEDFTDGRFEYTDPLGFIDTTYERFFIHVSGIKKKIVNPYQYRINGKIRVGADIYNFKGIIKITAADTETIDFYALPNWKEGYFASEVLIYEDKRQAGSGFIIGKLQTSFVIDSNGRMQYDAIMLVADGFSNNQFEGTWTSYANHQTKKCNWGDFRIPDCGDLDGGAGEFIPNEKYLDSGWRSLYESQMGSIDDDKRLSAEKRENEMWWR